MTYYFEHPAEIEAEIQHELQHLEQIRPLNQRSLNHESH